MIFRHNVCINTDNSIGLNNLTREVLVRLFGSAIAGSVHDASTGCTLANAEMQKYCAMLQRISGNEAQAVPFAIIENPDGSLNLPALSEAFVEHLLGYAIGGASGYGSRGEDDSDNYLSISMLIFGSEELDALYVD